MKRTRALAVYAFTLTGVVGGGLGACSTRPQEEAVARSSAGLTIAPNQPIPGPPWLHETAVAAVLDPQTQMRRWVVGSNNCQDPLHCNGGKVPAWSFSTDLTGTSWTTSLMSTGADWGDPGIGSNGVSFVPGGGLLGDPGLAAVTDPSISNNGSRVIYTSVAYDGAGNVNSPSDIVAAVSDDGGAHFHDAQYVDIPLTSCAVKTGGWRKKCGAGGTDGPFIQSDASGPFSTYVSWTAGGDGWINWIRFDAPNAGGGFTRGHSSPDSERRRYWEHPPQVRVRYLDRVLDADRT